MRAIPRRNFLKLSAGTVMAATLGALPLPAASHKRALRKAIMYGTIKTGGSVLEKFQAAREAGFEGVEPMGSMNQEDVLKARDATGLEMPSVCCATHWAKPLSDPNPAVREEGLTGLKQALRDAKAYGASSVLLVPGVVNERVAYDQAYERSQAEIRKAIPLAEELGVKIAVENVWNDFLLSPLEAARYVDEFNSPWVRWHFDIGNVLRYGWPEHWIAILGKRIQQIHIKEYSRKKRDSEGLWKGFQVALLEGDNNWPAIMKALDHAGYTGWGIAEQGGGNTPEGLRSIAEAMDKIFAS